MSKEIVRLPKILKVVSSLVGVLGVSAICLPALSQSYPGYPFPSSPNTSRVNPNTNSTVILPNGTIIIPNSQPVYPDTQPSFNSTETTIEVLPSNTYGGYGGYQRYYPNGGYGSYYNYGRRGENPYYDYSRQDGYNPYYDYNRNGNYGRYYDRREPYGCSNIIPGSPIGSPILVTPTGQACR
jgi:hypothetical protein